MKIKIYDYTNTLTEIETTKEIESICVGIINGDEIVDIYYEDGTMETYDSCPNNRAIEL